MYLSLTHYSTHAFHLTTLAVPAFANAGHDCGSFVRSVNVFVQREGKKAERFGNMGLKIKVLYFYLLFLLLIK